jgi:inner membrane protein
VDNLCHTLVGAAFGEAGLKRTTPLANATLMVAANLPDVDVLVFATGVPSVAIRRGWTHGVLAQAMLPLAFASIVYAVGRSRGARFGPLVLLSYVGVYSHVLLDLLNNYGVRLLMPFSNRWFYGDALFIVDVWLWLMLGAGVWLSRRRHEPRPARRALLAAAVYITIMVTSARMARDLVIEQWTAETSTTPRTVMAGPLPLTPFHRQVIVDAGTEYAIGRFSWFTRQTTFQAERVPKNEADPAVRVAVSRDRRTQAVLTWVRFPYFRVIPVAGGTEVSLRDLRFGDRVGGVTSVVAATADR